MKLLFRGLFRLACMSQDPFGATNFGLSDILSNDNLSTSSSMVRGGFVEHLSWTLVAQQTVTKNIAMIVINLVTTKVVAKRELLFNKPDLS